MITSLAWRNIWRNKTRSLVIMVSIALGLFAGVAVLALYEGMLKSRVRTVIDEETGHIQIHHPAFSDDFESKYFIGDQDKVLEKIRSIPEVIQVNQRCLTQGMLATATGTSGVTILGVDTTTEYSFSSLKSKIIIGSGFTGNKKGQIIIGKKLADKMKLNNGAKLVLMFNDTSNNLVSAAFRVVSVYQSTNTPMDERNVYVSRSELAELTGMPGQVQETGLRLAHDKDVVPVASKLRQLLPHLKTETWMELSPETDFMVKTVDTYSYIIMVIIMVALAFGILNTMLMAIMERTREIGMIAALGTSRIRIFFMVLLETAFLTLAGAPVGVLAGWLAAAYYNRRGLDLSGMGEDMMGQYGFKTMIYPEFPLAKLGPVLGIVVITAILASLLPALKAIKMKPIDALRN